MTKPKFLNKAGTAIVATRTYTDDQGKTHCGVVEWKGAPVPAGETSIVPPGLHPLLRRARRSRC